MGVVNPFWLGGGGGASSSICPNNVYFQNFSKFHLTRIQAMYGVISLFQPQYVN